MSRALSDFLNIHLPRIHKLAWFGFAADPPTLAHRSMLDLVLGSGNVEKIVVFPSGPVPYKQYSASISQRIDMIDLWMTSAEFGDEILFSLFDIFRDTAWKWFDLWNKVNQLAPNIEHCFVVGSDQYGDIAHSWYRGAELMERGVFLVIPREGYPVVNLHPKHLLIDSDPLPGSSTEVRDRNFAFVDEGVKDYILSEGLYRQCQ